MRDEESEQFRKVANLKWSLHHQIYDKVLSYNSEKPNNFLVIREPYFNSNNLIHKREKHPACKVIVVVNNMHDAVELKSYCENAVNETNKEIEDTLTGARMLRALVHYNIKIIEPIGDVVLTRSTAESRQKLRKEIITRRLADKIFEDDFAKEIEYINSLLKKNKEYTLAISTGTSYKCTYYDMTLEKRNQVSVGNILIVCGSTNTHIVENDSLRKKRSDSLEVLYSFRYKDTYFTIYEDCVENS